MTFNPADSIARELIIRSFIEQKKWNEALAECKMEEKYSKSPELRLLEGRIYSALNRDEEGLCALDDAIKVMSTSQSRPKGLIEARSMKADIYKRRGQTTLAQEELKKARTEAIENMPFKSKN